MKIKVVFFGSSTFSIPFLEVCNKKTDLCCIVTTEDKPKGRGRKRIPNSIKSLGESLSIPVLTPRNISSESFLNSISDFNPTLFVTASYGKILPKELLSIPSMYSINIHPSLLPKYRGADPLFWQIVKQEKKSGVSIFQMLPSLDNGPILKQKGFTIEKTETYSSLEHKCLQLGVKLLEELILDIETDKNIQLKNQTQNKLFYARKRTSADELINWHQDSSAVLALIRAFPSYIGAFTTFYSKRVKIIKAKETDFNSSGSKNGQITIHSRNLYVKCNDTHIQVEELKPEGKSIMKASDFINGNISKNAVTFFI
ncbi:MAG: methionyl-tRNA formyltransferase [Caldisericia bacterium]|nr:methionyl-tRNA formyltransferase [Caldisericia bacterium]